MHFAYSDKRSTTARWVLPSAVSPICVTQICKAGRGVYHAALLDYMNPPSLPRLSLSGYRGGAGQAVSIGATARCGVAAVTVRVCGDQAASY